MTKEQLKNIITRLNKPDVKKNIKSTMPTDIFKSLDKYVDYLETTDLWEASERFKANKKTFKLREYPSLKLAFMDNFYSTANVYGWIAEYGKQKIKKDDEGVGLTCHFLASLLALLKTCELQISCESAGMSMSASGVSAQTVSTYKNHFEAMNPKDFGNMASKKYDSKTNRKMINIIRRILGVLEVEE